MVLNLPKIGVKYIHNFIQNNDLDFSGIYKMIGAENKVLYIGKAKNLKNRLKSYTILENKQLRLQNMISQILTIEIIVTSSEHEALVLEASLIRSLKPKYNILLKDDKSYPFIMIRQDHDFGQIQKYRGKKDSKNLFFGPFASTRDVDNTISIIQKLFRLRNCSDSYFKNRERPCLEYQMKRCSAPCVNMISKEDYQKSIKQAELFMRGKNNIVQQELVKLMEKYSSKLEFEKAAELRDQVQILNKVQSKNLSFISSINLDVIAIHYLSGTIALQLYIFRGGLSYGNKTIILEDVDQEEFEEVIARFILDHYSHTNEHPDEIITNTNFTAIKQLEKIINIKIIIPKIGEKKELLDFAEHNCYLALKEKLKNSDKNSLQIKKLAAMLSKTEINRIEAYDNSHIMGTNAVGAMVCVTEHGFIKDQYRKFNIKDAKGGDDLAMMEEVLTRRFQKLDNDFPDLIIIDGGKTQLGKAIEVRNKFNLEIKIISIAKGEFRNKGNETVFTDDGEIFELDNDSEEAKYLQIIRDEVHRYAITTHRKKRSKSMLVGALNKIPGIGMQRKKLLLNYFGSVENIKNSTVTQLANVKGISKDLAQNILDFLNN